MPRFTFVCRSAKHPAASPRQFEAVIPVLSPEKAVRVDQYPCPSCGAIAQRDLVADLATVNVNGLTPIRPTDSKYGIGKELEFAFGKYKQNPDGSVDGNHAPFRDTGELGRYMAGANDLGDPVLDDKGRPLRRRDGSIVRNGAKIFKYASQAAPSRSDVPKRRRRVPNAWTTEAGVRGSTGGLGKF